MLGLTASANSYYPLDGLIYFINKYSIDFDGVDDRIITDGADTVAQPTTYSFWSEMKIWVLFILIKMEQDLYYG